MIGFRIAATSAILLMGTMWMPAHAERGLGGAVRGVTGAVGGTVSHVTGAVGGAVGGGLGNTVSNTGSALGSTVSNTGSALGGTVNSVTSGVGNTVSSLGGSASQPGRTTPTSSPATRRNTPRSTLLANIDARVGVLSKRELVRLCLGVGGAARCGGDREQVERLVDARLKLLSRDELAQVCVQVGSSCGGERATKATADARGRKAVANARVKSDLVGGIRARAAVLSRDELARVCLSAGGGDGCGKGNRTQVLRVLDTRLAALQPNRLLDLCLSVGGSCGSGVAAANPGRPGNPGGQGLNPRPPRASASPGPTSGADSRLSRSEQRAMRNKCPTILSNPAAFDADLVELCKLARRI